jgi:thiamine biosynthesis lipoprotein
MKLVFSLLACLFLPGLSRSNPPDSLKRYEFSHGQMGTIFKIICYAREEDKAENTVMTAFKIIDSLNLVFSDYLPGSELNQLCEQSGSGKYVKVSKALYDIIKISKHWSRISYGSFDITVGPYTQLWRRASRLEKLPQKEQLASASLSVGYKYIKIKRFLQEILLEKPGMQLDLGGIAQGYTSDLIYKFMCESNIPICLVDAGGDIYTGSAPPGKKGWRIAFEDLEKNNKNIILNNSAITTSGDLYHHFDFEGVRYSHILDPSTGIGITIPRTVTIMAQNATTADAVSKILSVCGPEKGFRITKKIKGINALIIQEEEGSLKRYEQGKFDFVE